MTKREILRKVINILFYRNSELKSYVSFLNDVSQGTIRGPLLFVAKQVEGDRGVEEPVTNLSYSIVEWKVQSS